MKNGISLLFCLCMFFRADGQDRAMTDTVRDLDNIIVEYNKWEQKINEVPNKIVRVDMKEARLRNPQTSADLLAMGGAVFIQKSQLGGGSPMIRGFATNRVLIVVDGVRMNNAIFRSGNIQNIISIDPLALDEAEVIFGPGSLIYGSDAIGGVMDFHSLKPRFSRDGRMLVKGSAFTRYSTANNERTFHADINFGTGKMSALTSVSYSHFGDLRMGLHGGQDSYLRPEYVRRINNADSIVPNRDPRVQRFSGYDQWNILHKMAFRISETSSLQYSFTYAGTGNAPRYDRLIQYRQGKLRFADWYYGPMIWRMHQLQFSSKKKTALYDESKWVTSYQDYDESRFERARGSASLNQQAERVTVYTLNWDATKETGKAQIFYGLEGNLNMVNSFGIRTNINTGESVPFLGRYPDGSNTKALGAYLTFKQNLGEQFTVTAGARFSYNTLNASFDTTFIKFPYGRVDLRDAAPTGSLGMVYRPKKGWQMNMNLSTGFRMPNIDDMGKFFETAPGLITVPNPELRSEYAWNIEVGLARRSFQKMNFELTAFYTILDNAIVRRPFTFNGGDSIIFGGISSAVEALQNLGHANVWGLQLASEVYITPKLIWQLNANWVKGRETDDASDIQVPVRHAPPFYGNTNVRYTAGKLTAEFSVFYNATVRTEDLAPSEKAKADIYARDALGNPYSPSWYTINLKCSYPINRHFSLNAGWENMTNQRYRPYSSGIVSAGSNLVVSARAVF